MIFKKTIIIIHAIFLQFYYCNSESKIIKSQNTEEAPVIKKVENNNVKHMEKETAQKKEMIFTSIAGGMDHSCALTNNGDVWCWGNNELGQLGDGSNNNSTIPVEVASDGDEFISISANGDYTCAMSSKKEIKCWGYNKHGQLGAETGTNKSIPVEVKDIKESVKEIFALGIRTCATTNSNKLICWGGYESYAGYLYYHVINVDVNKILQSVEDVKGVISESYHTCILKCNGEVKCLGYNTDGELGDGTYKYKRKFVSVKHINNKAVQLAAGGKHTCVIVENGIVKCWGSNENGMLGDGTTISRNVPVLVKGISEKVLKITSGEMHTCALLESGAVKCWGHYYQGQLGDGSYEKKLTAVDVVGLDKGVIDIVAGSYHTCAIMKEGGIKCWGINLAGQLGDGTETNRNMPVDVKFK